MQILLVEDEAPVARFIRRGLEAEGHRCTVIDDGKEALGFAEHGDHDLIILDRMLPRMDGLQVCRTLRARGVGTPVLMLTAMDSVEERVEGLRAGADDYLIKPFDFEELLARIEAIGRRSSLAEAESALVCGAISIDVPSRTVMHGKDVISLTAKEFDLLRLLASTPDRYWSRERILNRVWGSSSEAETNVIDVYISRLRRKLNGNTGGELIETQRGVGYRLKSKI